MKKNNILHMRNCRGVSTLTGPETYLLDLFDLSININRRFNLILACTINPTHKKKQMFIDEIRKRDITAKVIKIKKAFDLSELIIVSRMIKRFRIRLLHTHDARSDTLGLIISKIHRIPIVSFAHGWVNWESNFSKARLYAYLEAFAVSLSCKVVVASKHMQQDLIDKGIPKKSIHYIPYGIDIKKFNIDTHVEYIRKEFKIPQNIPLIGTVGRIHPWKGQKYFLEAARIVCEKYPEIKFMIVGDIAFDKHIKYLNELLANIKNMNLNDKVILTGSRIDIPQILNSLDLFVLPSLIEPFGIVIIEAQACGKPVVATSVGGIPEAMKDGETGILVKPKSSEDLANKIIYMIRNEKIRHKMGLNGRKRVERKFSKESMIMKTEALYKKMLGISK